MGLWTHRCREAEEARPSRLVRTPLRANSQWPPCAAPLRQSAMRASWSPIPRRSRRECCRPQSQESTSEAGWREQWCLEAYRRDGRRHQERGDAGHDSDRHRGEVRHLKRASLENCHSTEMEHSPMNSAELATDLLDVVLPRKAPEYTRAYAYLVAYLDSNASI